MAKIEYSHEYKVGDVIVPGVTTINANLGWNKKVLMKWVAKVTKEGKDFQAMSTEAAGTGTLAHAFVEAHLTGDVVKEETIQSYSEKQQNHARDAFLAFRAWEARSALRLVAAEKEVVSTKYMYGGTVDAIYESDAGLEVADVKTSNSTYADYIIQLSAYATAAEEVYGRPVVRIHVLRFGKGVKGVFHHSSWGVDTIAVGMSVFKSLLNIHRLRTELEELL